MDRGRRQRSRLLTGLPTLPAFLMPHEIHVYAALCSALSDSFRGAHGPQTLQGCRWDVPLQGVCSVSLGPWASCKVPEQDSGSLGSRVCVPIHAASHSFIQDLLTAGDK